MATNEADEARRYTKKHLGKSIHRDKFRGSPRKLKGKPRGTWVQIGTGRWKWVSNGH